MIYLYNFIKYVCVPYANIHAHTIFTDEWIDSIHRHINYAKYIWMRREVSAAIEYYELAVFLNDKYAKSNERAPSLPHGVPTNAGSFVVGFQHASKPQIHQARKLHSTRSDHVG